MPSIVIPGQYESLAQVAAFIRTACQEADLDDFAAYQVETAVDEACTNIIDYAYGGEGHGSIRCSYHISPDDLTITLEDNGMPFNPKGVKQPDIHAPLGEREARGLGLFIIQQWMDDVRFEFLGGQNILTMVKHLTKAG
ncbi:MAG: ATP-binding protein [Anaerolineae bacterium]|jgi:serine/threonine-protein kinase RsbW|nr:ATP-binding protein [Anaerolineae bacterium]